MTTTLHSIAMADVSANLLADIGTDVAGFQAFKADYAGATSANQCFHVVFSAATGRGGVVFVGSGSDGRTSWTDAASAEEVLTRHVNDDMAP